MYYMHKEFETDDEVAETRANLKRANFSDNQIDAFIQARSMAAGPRWNRKLAEKLLRENGFNPDSAEAIAMSMDLQRR